MDIKPYATVLVDVKDSSDIIFFQIYFSHINNKEKII